jgi:hypothetical protein
MTLLQLMNDGLVDTPEDRQEILNECYDVALHIFKTIELNDEKASQLSKQLPDA